MQNLDYEWFLDNYNTLFEKYGCSYLAIKDKKVLGSYDSYAKGISNTEKTEELGTFIVQYCNGKDDGYTTFISSTNFAQ